jgi:surface antigen
MSSIAAEYSVDASKIQAQNDILDGKLKQWQEIIVPWAKKKIVAPPTPVVRSKTTSSWGYKFVKPATSNYVAPISGWYNLVRRQPQHTFYWGNCTRFVWQYKNVNWWGNANMWMRNARAKWHATWYQATPWAIIQFWGSGYNPRYGHVWIVKKVEGNELVIVDMNYRRINEITYRRISASHPSIKGYIYVD